MNQINLKTRCSVFFPGDLAMMSPKTHTRYNIYQSKGGDPMSHCLKVWSSTARIWIVASDEVRFGWCDAFGPCLDRFWQWKGHSLGDPSTFQLKIRLTKGLLLFGWISCQKKRKKTDLPKKLAGHLVAHSLGASNGNKYGSGLFNIINGVAKLKKIAIGQRLIRLYLKG